MLLFALPLMGNQSVSRASLLPAERLFSRSGRPETVQRLYGGRSIALVGERKERGSIRGKDGTQTSEKGPTV